MRIFILLLFSTSALLSEQLQRVANTTLTLPEATPVETGLQFVNALGTQTFSQPLDIDSAPGQDSHLFITEKTGRIQRTSLSSGSKAEFFDIRDIPSATSGIFQSGGERGLLSMAFHPNYETNGHLFIFYSFRLSTGEQYQRIARLTATPVGGSYLNATRVDSNSMLPLITQRDEASNHNAGDLHFGADGYLYISVGDEGSARDSFNNSNFINKDFHSAILRIDVDNQPGNLSPNSHNQDGPISSAITADSYSVPADNPFVGATNHQGVSLSSRPVRTEIWVAGLRNPFRFSFDGPTGECFIADVGQNAREEINLVAGGEDCGWSRKEGLIAHNAGPAGFHTATELNSFGFHDPIYDYPRNLGTSVTGGIVYRGSRISELFGHYIFSDYNSGRVWSLERQTDGSWDPDIILTQTRLTSFNHDPVTGDLLSTNISTGEVLRLVRATQSNAPPQTLSETGAFTDLTSLTPRDGIYAYDVNLPFWSDHATKRRWFSIPDESSQMIFSTDGPWNFPEGQVWIKHFDLERERGNPDSSRKLETRFLVKTAEGAYGLSYRWNEDGTEALLVGPNGLKEDIPITDNGATTSQTWHFPSRADCMSCHLPSSNFALSFHSAQLNRSGSLGSDQIDTLSCAGFLNTAPPVSQSLPAHPALDDNTVSREERVRSYLDVNCAMCHRQDAAITPALFDSRLTVSTDAAQLINGILSDSLGDPQNRVIVPGDNTHSGLLTRLSNGATRMPPLASSVEDSKAIALISDWITLDLPSRQSFSDWAQAEFGSAVSAEDDADGDGDTNRMEYLAGTDPNDSSSRFQLTFSTDEVNFMHPANRRLLIEQSTDLQTWLPLSDSRNRLAAPAVEEMRQLSLPPAENIFLRARMEAP